MKSITTTNTPVILFFMVLTLLVLLAITFSIISLIQISKIYKLAANTNHHDGGEQTPTQPRIGLVYTLVGKIDVNTEGGSLNIPPGTPFTKIPQDSGRFEIDYQQFGKSSRLMGEDGIIDIPEDGLYRFILSLRATDGNALDPICVYKNHVPMVKNSNGVMFLPTDTPESPLRRTASYVYTFRLRKSDQVFLGPWCGSSPCEDPPSNSALYEINIGYVQLMMEKWDS